MLAVSNESPLAKKSAVTLEELRRQPMILRLPSSGNRNLFVAHLESRGLHIEAVSYTHLDVYTRQGYNRMQYSREVEEMFCVKKGAKHDPAPVSYTHLLALAKADLYAYAS